MKRLLMLMSAGSMIAMAAPAYADPPSDADFISQLKAAGLTDQDPAAGRVLPEIPDRRGSTPETARCSRELSG